MTITKEHFGDSSAQSKNDKIKEEKDEWHIMDERNHVKKIIVSITHDGSLFK